MNPFMSDFNPELLSQSLVFIVFMGPYITIIIIIIIIITKNFHLMIHFIENQPVNIKIIISIKYSIPLILKTVQLHCSLTLKAK